MRKFFAVALSALLVVPFPAVAGDCRTTYNHAYVAPVYAQQHYVHQAYDYNQIIVPKAFQVQVAAPFYMGVADDYRQLNFAKQVAEEYSKIVEYQRQQLNLGAAPQSLPLTTPKPTSKIGAILAKNCAGCHSPGKQAPDLSGNPDEIPELVRLKAFAASSRGEMPKGKPPLPQDEFNAIGEWSKHTPNDHVPPKIPAAKEPGLTEAKK